MFVSWRLPVLVLLGIGPVLLRPEDSTVWAWLGLVALAVAFDVALAPARSALHVVRRPVGRTRQGEPGSTTLTITNTGRRTARGVVRDAWQPSAGASTNRHRLQLSGSASVDVTSGLLPEPTRRPADRQGHRANARSPRTGRSTGRG